MRFFTLVIATFSVVISANASNIQKSELTAGYQTCTEIMKRSTEFIEMFKTKVASSAHFSTDTLLDRPLLSIGKNIFYRTDYCCKDVAPNMNAEDIKAAPAFLSDLFNEYDSLVSFLASHQMRLEKNEELATWAYKTVGGVKDRLHTLSTCLNPGDKTFLDKLDNAYSALKDPELID